MKTEDFNSEKHYIHKARKEMPDKEALNLEQDEICIIIDQGMGWAAELAELEKIITIKTAEIHDLEKRLWILPEMRRGILVDQVLYKSPSIFAACDHPYLKTSEIKFPVIKAPELSATHDVGPILEMINSWVDHHAAISSNKNRIMRLNDLLQENRHKVQRYVKRNGAFSYSGYLYTLTEPVGSLKMLKFNPCQL